MVGKRLTMRIQKTTTYLLIITAAINMVFALGFMTNFYQLFYDGNSEMYEFYQQIQTLNNVVFQTALIGIVLAILHLPFDFNKKVVSAMGVVLTSATTIVNIMNVMVVLNTNAYFLKAYNNIDFSSLEGYTVSTLPFVMTQVLFVSSVVFSVIITVTSVWNFIQNRKQAVHA